MTCGDQIMENTGNFNTVNFIYTNANKVMIQQYVADIISILTDVCCFRIYAEKLHTVLSVYVYMYIPYKKTYLTDTF